MYVYKQNRSDLGPLFLKSEVLKEVFVAVYRVMLLMLEVWKVVFAAVYIVMLLMCKVSKVNSFIYYVLHYMNKRSKGMLKVLKRLKIHHKGYNAMYVEGVEKDSKYTISAHDIFAYNLEVLKVILC